MGLTAVMTGETFVTLVIIGLVAWAMGFVLWFGAMAILRSPFNVARNEFGKDRGRITQFKADSLTEKQARRIYGDAEVDRFLKHGDYNEHMRRIIYDPMYDDSLDNEGQ